MSLRASITGEIVLEDVRLRRRRCCPASKGLRGPLSCLNRARFGIVFGAIGAARDCLQTAIDYAGTREVFDKPLAGYQITQTKVADMKALEVGKGFLLAMHLGRQEGRGQDRASRSAWKPNSTTWKARPSPSPVNADPVGRQWHHPGVPGDPYANNLRVRAAPTRGRVKCTS